MYWEGPGPSAATLHANSKKNTNTAGEDVATATHNTANPTDAPSSVTRVPFLKERWPAAQSWQAAAETGRAACASEGEMLQLSWPLLRYGAETKKGTIVGYFEF